ncbi:MAG: AhpC/TSA family protein [Dysgonamonadaceae bacterium]|jgi:thiol-disulfide isomerase/thioredoxin|nr:AhpC/TSA family protein [Dysgonamonadaceae bacterium]
MKHSYLTNTQAHENAYSFTRQLVYLSTHLRMKKLFYLSVCFLLCFSCSKPKYVITGETTNPEWEGRAIRLFSVDSTGNASLLSVDTIKNNTFSFSGNKNVLLGYIEFEGENELWKRYLLFEQGKMNVIIGNDFVVTGTPANDAYQDALNAEMLLEEIENQYYQEKESGFLTAELEDKLNRRYDEQFENAKKAYAVFFKNNINNPLGREIFANTRWTRRLNSIQLESVLEVADSSFRTTELYRTNNERLYNMKTSIPGNNYKDIVSKDPDGNVIALSDYTGKGKYVLLDFWASWCPPCREEAPNLVKLYNEYKGKNLEIVSYSLDKNKEAWKKGIETLNLTWPQMSDCEYWDSPAVKLYAVQSIPCTVLIDPEGKIIEKGLLGNNLEETLKFLIK